MTSSEDQPFYTPDEHVKPIGQPDIDLTGPETLGSSNETLDEPEEHRDDITGERAPTHELIEGAKQKIEALRRDSEVCLSNIQANVAYNMVTDMDVHHIARFRSAVTLAVNELQVLIMRSPIPEIDTEAQTVRSALASACSAIENDVKAPADSLAYKISGVAGGMESPYELSHMFDSMSAQITDALSVAQTILDRAE